jgi:predicted transcriptional regulator
MQIQKALATERNMSKRGKFEICADILRVLDSGFECKRATIATKSNLDSRASSKYLELLLRQRLALNARNTHAIFVISDKGKKYLNVYAKLVEILE